MQQEPTIPQSQPYGQPPETPHMPSRKKKREGFKSILSTLSLFIAAPLIAILLTAFVFQSYEVDGPSMESTLHNQDRLVVVKLGPTWAKLTGRNYMPERGEIVVFNRNDDSHGTGERQLIKRVIGLPGDRVVVRGGTITIYNDASPQGFDPDANTDYADQISDTTPGNVDLTVPEGEIFVAGDNRLNSLDSRSFGTIEANSVVGSLLLRIYPLSKFDTY